MPTAAKASNSSSEGSLPSGIPAAEVVIVRILPLNVTEAPATLGESVQLAGAKAPPNPLCGGGTGNVTM